MTIVLYHGSAVNRDIIQKGTCFTTSLCSALMFAKIKMKDAPDGVISVMEYDPEKFDKTTDLCTGEQYYVCKEDLTKPFGYSYRVLYHTMMTRSERKTLNCTRIDWDTP